MNKKNTRRNRRTPYSIYKGNNMVRVSSDTAKRLNELTKKGGELKVLTKIAKGVVYVEQPAAAILVTVEPDTPGNPRPPKKRGRRENVAIKNTTKARQLANYRKLNKACRISVKQQREGYRFVNIPIVIVKSHK